ncbi:TatD family hydrolase [Endozoicomonas sp. SCSIO W0465]|uniref:TatD family hydrolase n=1 Tax=Endozoicomonas sp. SCSIO W0465 TaxID=2918516 RepID=UPI002075D364|nr:TatD family hydrolase [Endozoicomonas sp. SCSIO W0465]USE34363.1 TatD family hydrolase [Endozoicomonas sp. SCSIO W0465]
MFIDSHCHLDHLDLSAYEGSLDLAVAAAREAGVDRMLCIGINLENGPEVVSLAEQYEDVYASVGVHPLDCKEIVPDIDVVRSLASHKKVVAIGETGLDYCYATTEGAQAVQRQSFINHLELAAELALPVVVHTRDAREDTLDFLREYGSRESAGVLHCFTESLAMAKAALDLNYYISISGIVTFRNAAALREVVEYLPMDRLLIETDSPYLAPVPHRGKSNEPRFVADVARFAAGLKGVTAEELGAKTSDNFYRLFHRAV